MNKSNIMLPSIGDKMYFVCEHLFYVKDYEGPVLEYCVCEGSVMNIYRGKMKEIRLLGKNPNGHLTPFYFKFDKIRKKLFNKPEEAAKLAEDMTNKYESTWSGLGYPNIPLRRTWEEYLR